MARDRFLGPIHVWYINSRTTDLAHTSGGDAGADIYLASFTLSTAVRDEHRRGAAPPRGSGELWGQDGQ